MTINNYKAFLFLIFLLIKYKSLITQPTTEFPLSYIKSRLPFRTTSTRLTNASFSSSEHEHVSTHAITVITRRWVMCYRQVCFLLPSLFLYHLLSFPPPSSSSFFSFLLSSFSFLHHSFIFSFIFFFFLFKILITTNIRSDHRNGSDTRNLYNQKSFILKES